MSEAHELKPCPFCGGEAGATKDGDYHVVMCSNCMASLADRTRWTAVHMWNTRTDAITPQMAAKVLLEAQNLDGMTLLPNYVRAMLRTIAQETTE